MADDKKTAQVSQVQIILKLGDAPKVVAQSEIGELSIVSELDHPDSCAITLKTSGVTNQAAGLKQTDKVVVGLAHLNDKDDTAFIGELTGVEPVFAKKGTTLVIRALNGLHALSRGKRSFTYGGGGDKISETDIIKQVQGRNGSVITKVDYDGATPDSLKYDHVYQHNQTDLEFLRSRAARIGYCVMVRDKTLLFRRRSNKKSEFKLMFHAERVEQDQKAPIQLDRFVPRLSTANVVTEVRVRSWQPEKRTELVCIAKLGDPKVPAALAPETGTDTTKQRYPDAAQVRVDIPFSSKEEGEAIAASWLNERAMSYVTAEGSTPGDPSLKAGMIVTIDVGKQSVEAQFSGEYLLTYVRHWYRDEGEGSRFTTDFRARRDGNKPPKTNTTEEAQ